VIEHRDKRMIRNDQCGYMYMLSRQQLYRVQCNSSAIEYHIISYEQAHGRYRLQPLGAYSNSAHL